MHAEAAQVQSPVRDTLLSALYTSAGTLLAAVLRCLASPFGIGRVHKAACALCHLHALAAQQQGPATASAWLQQLVAEEVTFLQQGGCVEPDVVQRLCAASHELPLAWHKSILISWQGIAVACLACPCIYYNSIHCPHSRLFECLGVWAWLRHAGSVNKMHHCCERACPEVQSPWLLHGSFVGTATCLHWWDVKWVLLSGMQVH